MSIVLAEDKQYYQDATQVYEGVETIFQEEDSQPIHVPIIAPKRTINFDLTEPEPELNFSYDYLKEAMNYPSFVRTFSLIGPLHSGKTALVDILVKHVRDTRSQKEKDAQLKLAKDELKLAGNRTADSPWDNFKQTKPNTLLEHYTDSRLDERERELTLKSTPLSYMLADSRGKSHLLNVIDTPGHVNFHDECEAAVRVSDGIVIVIDVVMGASECVKRQVKRLISEGGFEPSQLILVVTQIDRLILELRLPPNDAYFKLRYVIDDLNAAIGKSRFFKPESGNILFASGKFQFCFSLSSFARRMYVDAACSFTLVGGERPSSLLEESEAFSSVLWGDIYCENGRFSRSHSDNSKRTFVQFVLEPLYKIIGACVSMDAPVLKKFLAEAGVFLPVSVLERNVDEVLVAVMDSLLGGVSPLVDAVTEFIPSSLTGNERAVSKFYNGDVTESVTSSNKDGPLLVHCVKAVHSSDCMDFLLLARVYSGTLKRGDHVRVLGESYSFRTGETEDAVVSVVDDIFIPGGRYLVSTEAAGPGNLVFISGLHGIRKSATLTSAESGEEMETFRALKFPTAAIKIACEPLQPAELPRMIEALRRLERAYPAIQTKVEESGEHVIIGSGELYLDCALHDLRKLYGGESVLEIRLADPAVVFNETCSDASQFQCSAASPNKLNAVSFICEPLTDAETKFLVENHVANREKFFLSKEFRKERVALLQDQCGWDALASRNLWAFGPDWERGSSLLLNDTLPDQVSKADLMDARDSVVQGFQWATREGPLVEECVRNCKFKLLDLTLNGNEIARGAGQIIPAACRAVYASLLTAGPKLLEPVNVVEIDVPAECLEAVFKVLSKRRGHVIKDSPKPGTPLTTVIAQVPLIDSFGLETDLRLFTKGLGFGLSWFDHWAVVPGDPLDQLVELRPLEPAPHQSLARDFLVKTRRRKGLAEDVVVQKFIDDVVGMGLVRADEPEGNPDEYY